MVLKHVAPFSRKRLEKTWRRACARLGLDAAETSVALVSAKRMTELHERYKPHKRGPTDVLAFPSPVDPGRAGEVFVCPRYVRQVSNGSLTLRLEEVAVHGLCHLAGYDHKDARAFASMKRRETSLLGRSGMPRHFADTL